jgi:predicted small secreted protein
MRIIALTIMVSLLAACSTVSGIGKDLQGASEWTKKQMEPSVKLDQPK